METYTKKPDPSQCTTYFCAALTAPSSMTAHMQAGDILVSINGVSLISDCNETDIKGASDAFFDIITATIKLAKSPRKVRLLRPLRLKSPAQSQKQAVFDINLSEHESSLLFDSNFKTHIPKFSVGKLPIGRLFEPVTASLFDVIFPFQRSLGIRIFPYKLINPHLIPKKIENLRKNSGIHVNNLLEDMLEDDSLEGIYDITREYDYESKEEDGESLDSEVMANVNDFLTRLESTEQLPDTLDEFDNICNRNNSQTWKVTQKVPEKVPENVPENAPVRNSGSPQKVPRSIPLKFPEERKDNKSKNSHMNLLRPGTLVDDDIVSDRGRMPVGVHVSRLEADGDDFIPVSSPTCGYIINQIEDDEVSEEITAPPSTTKAVGDIRAIFESSRSLSVSSVSRGETPRGETPRMSPTRRVVVTLDDLQAKTAESSPRVSSPRPSSLPNSNNSKDHNNNNNGGSGGNSGGNSGRNSGSNSYYNLLRAASPSIKDLVASYQSSPLDRSVLSSDKDLFDSQPNATKPLVEISPIKRINEKSYIDVSPAKAFPGLISKLTDLADKDKLSQAGGGLNDSTTQRIVSKAVEKIQVNLKSVTSENQQLKAKMDFYKKSVSIEKQLLNFELKGVKAKLQSSENN